MPLIIQHLYIYNHISSTPIQSHYNPNSLSMIEQSSFHGKMIKDYTLGPTILTYDPQSTVVKATKNNNTSLVIYAIKQEAITQQLFVPYFNQITNNSASIYPACYDIIKSQNYIYMVFENVSTPVPLPNSTQSVKNLLKSMEKLLREVRNKLHNNQLFLKQDGSYKLCYLPAYTTFHNKTSNLYGIYHNKSILAELFCEIVSTKNKNQCIGKLIENFLSADMLKIVAPYLTFPIEKEHVGKKSLMQLANDQYPDINDEQFEQLVAEVHVNNSMKKKAEEAFIRQSRRQEQNNREMKQQQKNEKEMKSILDNVKHSMFEIKYTNPKDKSKYEPKLQEIKEEQNQFQLYYKVYTSSFKLIKKVIRSYLIKYKKGYAGIIAVYFLTVIGALRKISLVCDLEEEKDIFNLGLLTKMDFSNKKKQLKKELVKEAKVIAILKNKIQNSSMPFKTFQTLMPYLEDDFQLIDRKELEKYCFFYMTTLLKMDNSKNYHTLLVLETLYMLLDHDEYAIVYDESDFPSEWDPKYYQLKKTLINAVLPSWSL